MTSSQKVIKYLAIGFGVFLSLNIIGAIIFGILTFTGVFAGIGYISNGVNSSNVEYVEFSQTYENINEIKLDIDIANLYIKRGDTLKVEAQNVDDDFRCNASDNVLEVKDKKNKNWFSFNVNKKEPIITIYIPEGIVFDEFKIKSGVGKAQIDILNTKKLDLDLGVGDYNLNNITADYASVDGGVGKCEFSNGEFGVLDLEVGVGNFSVDGIVKESGKFNCGVGKLDLDFKDSMNNYNIKTDVGIGAIYINSEKCSDKVTYGSGRVALDVDGGVGNVDITFANTDTI